MQRRRAQHLQGVEARFLQQLEFAHVAKAVQAPDVAGITAGGDSPAPVLELVDEGHAQAVVLGAGGFVLARPVEEEGAVALAADGVEPPLPGHGVGVVPLAPRRRHDIAGGLLHGEGGGDGEVPLHQCVHHLVPAVGAGRCGLGQYARRALEAMLLVLVVVVAGVALDALVFEEGFRQPVPPVLHGIEAPARGVEHVGPGAGDLRVMHGGLDALRLGLAHRRFQQGRGTVMELDAPRSPFS